MFKSTINKAFQKEFPNNIWKIEVDTFCNYLVIETRDAHTTMPQYTVLDFDGHIIMEGYSPSAKDWMLEGIQKGFIILKKVGENTPVKEGIQAIHAISGQEVFTSYEYQLLDVYEDYIKVRHRNVISGNEQFIHIKDGMLRSVHEIDTEHLPLNRVVFPVIYHSKPKILSKENFTDHIWLSKARDHYIWCYHQHQPEGYCLILILSDLNQILHRQVILDSMEKMILQPYFQVDQQLFFLSHNKQEIVSYLV